MKSDDHLPIHSDPGLDGPPARLLFIFKVHFHNFIFYFFPRGSGYYYDRIPGVCFCFQILMCF